MDSTIERVCETWPGVWRTLIVTAGTVAVAWRTPAVSEKALWVFLALGSPALLRTFAAPFLAWFLHQKTRGIYGVPDTRESHLEGYRRYEDIGTDAPPSEPR